jgi:hypothetical protein
MRKIPTWLKGGIISLLIYQMDLVVILPFLETIQSSVFGYAISEIIAAPFLIVSIPLYIFYSYLGFLLEAIYHTQMGYESLSLFPAGVIFMKIFSALYFFFVGVVIVKICSKIRMKTKPGVK